ncbi:HNH endonuclease [Gracilibacillus marinus]|uniref:HNH endonuclease n=1 Tax=Gracilibacillus marinus TaxID=630535 RepID=A0ABV8VVT4_9BACI
MNQTKQCTKCNEVKRVSEFNKDHRNKGSLRSYCRSCQANYNRQYTMSNIGKAHKALSKAKYNRKLAEKKYGISIKDTLKIYDIAFIQAERECIYCEQDVPRGQMTIDHVLTFAQGGTNEFSNLLPACNTCNKRKGSKPVLEFLKESCDEHVTKQVVFRLALRQRINYEEMLLKLQAPEQLQEIVSQ